MRKLIQETDKTVLLIYGLLVFIGLIMILDISSYSATLARFIKQIIWVIISVPTLIFCAQKIDLQKHRKLIFPTVVLVIVMLVAVLIFGEKVKGAQRSLNFGFMNFQPSLLARIVLIVYFAHLLDKKKQFIDDLDFAGIVQNFIPLILTTLVVFSLIFIGRHLSILVILAMTLFVMVFAAKIPYRIILSILLIIAIGVSIAIAFGPKYRGERMKVYRKYNLFTKEDSKVSSAIEYPVRMSLTALSVGGFWGVEGRAKDKNLPEAVKDYIFSVIGEQGGFLGASFVFILYLLLYIKGLLISVRQKSLFLKLLGIGLTHNIFYNALVHIGVCISLLPPTGVTLPFVSYGGSSLLINSASIGIILNISRVRR